MSHLTRRSSIENATSNPTPTSGRSRYATRSMLEVTMLMVAMAALVVEPKLLARRVARRNV